MVLLKKTLVTLSLASIMTVCFGTDASAYVLMGGKYTNAPLNQKYYNGCGTYVYNGSPTSFYNAVQSAVTSWNNTDNTKVYMFQTSTKSESIMDFSNADLGDINVLGQTNFWIGSTQVNPATTNWYWAKILINPNGNWTFKPTGAIYSSVDGKAMSAIAHEEGHALGLDHVGNYVLMYPSTAPYSYYGITTPQTDEVSGVRFLYGSLR